MLTEKQLILYEHQKKSVVKNIQCQHFLSSGRMIMNVFIIMKQTFQIKLDL